MKRVWSIVLCALLLALALTSTGALAVSGSWVERSSGGYLVSTALTGVKVSGYSSSGDLTDAYGSYPASNAFDGQLRTTWAENAGGDGIGCYVQGTWKNNGSKLDLVGIALSAGYQKNEDIYKKNNRPKGITLTVYDAGKEVLCSEQLTLDDYNGCQYIYLDTWQDFTSEITVRITIGSVYSGSKYQDTCISDIALLLNASESAASASLGDMRVVNCDEWVSLRSAPSTSASRLKQVPLGAVLTDCSMAASGFIHGTYNGTSGYIKQEYLTPVQSLNVGDTEKAGQNTLASSLYALFHGVSDAEYQKHIEEADQWSKRQNAVAASLNGVSIGISGGYHVGETSTAKSFLEELVHYGWYEDTGSDLETLLNRAKEVRLTESELYAWGSDRVTTTDEYYRFKLYVPYWGGGYDMYDVIFNLGYEADGGEWAEDKVLSSAHVDQIN